LKFQYNGVKIGLSRAVVAGDWGHSVPSSCFFSSISAQLHCHVPSMEQFVGVNHAHHVVSNPGLSHVFSYAFISLVPLWNIPWTNISDLHKRWYSYETNPSGRFLWFCVCAKLGNFAPTYTLFPPVKLPTPWSTVLLKKLTVRYASQENSILLWNPNIYDRVYDSPPLAPVMSHTDPIHLHARGTDIPIARTRFEELLYRRRILTHATNTCQMNVHNYSVR
jgi:hypothetical protein